jgi:hypothetical protein
MFRDYVPIVLIVAVLIIWLSSQPWQNAESVSIAGDVVKVAVGAIAGYMVRDSQKTGE